MGSCSSQPVEKENRELLQSFNNYRIIVTPESQEGENRVQWIERAQWTDEQHKLLKKLGKDYLEYVTQFEVLKEEVLSEMQALIDQFGDIDEKANPDSNKRHETLKMQKKREAAIKFIRAVKTDLDKVVHERLPPPSFFYQDTPYIFRDKPKTYTEQVEFRKGMLMQKGSIAITLQDLQFGPIIGKGETSEVFLCRFSIGGKYVVVKRISRAYIARREAMSRVLNDLNLSNTLYHPFILNMFTALQDNLYIYLVSELAIGGELLQLLSRVGKFPETVVKFYAAEIALLLQYLHRVENTVYRDLKLENILIDETGHISLIDLETARLLTPEDKKDVGIINRRKSKTDLNELLKEGISVWEEVGVIQYPAPEMSLDLVDKETKEFRGHGTAVDWWAFGCIIVEMMTGVSPQVDPSEPKIRKCINRGERIPISWRRTKPSQELVDLIHGLLEVDPDARFNCTNVMNHPWFCGIDWNAVFLKLVKPPFRPILSKPGDMRYLFNWSAIENPVSVSNPKTPEVVSTSQYQHKFKQKTKTTKAKYRDDFLTAEELNEEPNTSGACLTESELKYASIDHLFGRVAYTKTFTRDQKLAEIAEKLGSSQANVLMLASEEQVEQETARSVTSRDSKRILETQRARAERRKSVTSNSTFSPPRNRYNRRYSMDSSSIAHIHTRQLLDQGKRKLTESSLDPITEAIRALDHKDQVQSHADQVKDRKISIASSIRADRFDQQSEISFADSFDADVLSQQTLTRRERRQSLRQDATPRSNISSRKITPAVAHLAGPRSPGLVLSPSHTPRSQVSEGIYAGDKNIRITRERILQRRRNRRMSMDLSSLSRDLPDIQDTEVEHAQTHALDTNRASLLGSRVTLPPIPNDAPVGLRRRASLLAKKPDQSVQVMEPGLRAQALIDRVTEEFESQRYNRITSLRDDILNHHRKFTD